MCAPMSTPSPSPGRSASAMPRLAASCALEGKLGNVPRRSTTNGPMRDDAGCADAQRHTASTSARTIADRVIDARRLYQRSAEPLLQVLDDDESRDVAGRTRARAGVAARGRGGART